MSWLHTPRPPLQLPGQSLEPRGAGFHATGAWRHQSAHQLPTDSAQLGCVPTGGKNRACVGVGVPGVLEWAGKRGTTAGRCAQFEGVLLNSQAAALHLHLYPCRAVQLAGGVCGPGSCCVAAAPTTPTYDNPAGSTAALCPCTAAATGACAGPVHCPAPPSAPPTLSAWQGLRGMLVCGEGGLMKEQGLCRCMGLRGTWAQRRVCACKA